MRLNCLFPDLYVEDVFSINYPSLYEKGYRGLIFDIDNWMGWQHVIGAFGGLILAFLLCVLILMWVDLDAGPLFTILAVTAANFLLCVFFRENYRIIFIWLSAYLILSSTASSVIYLSDEEKAWGIAQICVTVLAAAALTLGLVFF